MPSICAVLVALLMPFFPVLLHPDLSFVLHLYYSYCFFYNLKEILTTNDKDIPGKVVTSGVQCHFRKKEILIEKQ